MLRHPSSRSKNPLTWDSTTPQGIRDGLSIIVTVTPLPCIEYVPFTPLPEKLPDVVSPLKSTPYFLMPAALATKVLGRSVVFTLIVLDILVSLSRPHWSPLLATNRLINALIALHHPPLRPFSCSPPVLSPKAPPGIRTGANFYIILGVSDGTPTVSDTKHRSR
jgi:hypothetical protein